jgi:Mor family transcriptional regulator
MPQVKVDAKEILDDINAGMDDVQLMNKYKLSSFGLQSVFQKLANMNLMKMINGREFFSDMRIGMSGPELMTKYHLSEKALQKLFAEIRRLGLSADPPQLDANNAPTCDGARPREDRYRVDYPLPIYQANLHRVVGRVRDVSEKGIGTCGIEAKAGDIKTLVVPADDFGEFATFMFDAECRWLYEDHEGEFVAGFEIHHMSISNMVEFQILLRLLRTAQQGTPNAGRVRK